MRLYAGTSGYSYKEWKGSFYPEDLAAADMLSHYASKLPTVEINNTFYRMPSTKVLEQWSEQVPEGFVFVLKASRRITHQHRLVGAQDSVSYLLNNAATLGDKLGPILFQLPPFLRKDLPRLEGFLDDLPSDRRFTIEFRHDSWFDDETYAALRKNNVALCCADGEEGSGDEPISTADWGYVRLRRDEYGEAEIGGWVDRIRRQEWNAAFVFFKHEEEGPRLALDLQQRFDS